MPGGHLHSPVWQGYALYGSVDYVYGWPAFEANDGFTAAQSSLNVVETLGYLVYLWMVWKEGGRDGKEPGIKGRLEERVEGGWAAAAVLARFAFSVMTLSKTVLYGMNEFHSGCKNIGHNDASTIVFLWIVPNGAWIVLSAYKAYVFGSNILEGHLIASNSTAGPARTGISHKEE
ncbi:hypothetical protein MMC29_002718 [Sticta canariensis]|nr:hypothetical protein [Sticta canariensis]